MVNKRLLEISSRLFREFISSEQSGGVFLVVSTVIALAIANSPLQSSFHDFLHLEVYGLSVEHWIDDGLMVLFFLLVGLELEREVYLGELRTFRKAILPVVAAIGGMILPAAIHWSLNYGTEFQSGVGIPTATDIAFSLALLSLVAKRVPFELKMFLAAVAIADDLGAVILIAAAYTKTISITYLLLAALVFIALCIANRRGHNALLLYLVGGVFLWFFTLRSGVHATIAGVLLAFALPFRDGNAGSPSYRLQHLLHYPVAFIVLPFFALANTGISFSRDSATHLLDPNSLGIILGLSVGKPVGILLACWLLTISRLAELPKGLNWRHLVGVSITAGIGFTMSIFVTNLAFDDHQIIDHSRLAIMASLAISAVTGLLWFMLFVPKHENHHGFSEPLSEDDEISQAPLDDR